MSDDHTEAVVAFAGTLCGVWRPRGVFLHPPPASAYSIERITRNNMENSKNGNYFKLLELVQQMLNLTTAYKNSPAILKLHLYALAIELWHVIQQFEKLKIHYDKEWILNIDNLDKDTGIEYSEWLKGENLQFPLTGAYPTIDQLEISMVRSSLDEVEKRIIKSSEEEAFNVDVQSISTALCNKIQCSHLGATIKSLLTQLRGTLTEIHKLLSKNEFTEEKMKQFFDKFLNHGNFYWSNMVKEKFDEWQQKNNIDNDLEQLERHYIGKIRREMTLLFQSGFLNPRLKDQEEVDAENLESELRTCKIDEIKEIENPRYHYFALRELFDGPDRHFAPREKFLGRYIIMYRKSVNEQMRQACYRFIRTLQLLAETKHQLETQMNHSLGNKNLQTDNNSSECRGTSKRGPKRAQIFHEKDKREQIAIWIKDTYRKYYDQKIKAIIVEGKSYNLTDFLLATYFVLVEKKHVIGVIWNNINNQYYRFLTQECQLENLIDSQKTFRTHLNKLIKTGKEFHLLNTEDIVNNSSSGGYNNEEYNNMKNITATIKRLL